MIVRDSDQTDAHTQLSLTIIDYHEPFDQGLSSFGDSAHFTFDVLFNFVFMYCYLCDVV